jgi:magnesium chelatase family protein
MIQRYMAKISGPLLDRIDIHIDVPAVNYKEMRAGSEPGNSGSIRARVMPAREIQLRRFASSHTHQAVLQCSDGAAAYSFFL